MKTKILLTHLSLLLFIASYSQTYIPFVKEGKEWTEISVCGGDTNIKSIWNYSLEGDTLIGGKNHKIILGQYENYYVYEDTANKKVYFYNSFTSTDTLWYDFSLQLGDSLEVECEYLTVIDKQIEYFAGFNRTKLVFSCGPFPCLTWFEGIGSVNGVFYPQCITGGYNYLLCYFENNTLLYHNPYPPSDCYNFTDNLEIPTISIKSNYSNNVLNIQTFSPEKYIVIIYDLFGRLINTKEFQQELSLDLSAFTKGIYIYSIQSNNLNYCLKDKLIIE